MRNHRYINRDTIELIELTRAGDERAFGELYERYVQFAQNIARRIDRKHADDLVAEAFTRTYSAIRNGNGPTDAFGPYLAVVLRSCLSNRLHRAGPETASGDDLVRILDGDARAHADEPARDDDLVEAFRSLPEPWQNALWLAEVEDLPPRKAAPMMDLPTANAFSALVKRAKAGLRMAYAQTTASNCELRSPDETDLALHAETCDLCRRTALLTPARLASLGPAFAVAAGLGTSSSAFAAPVAAGLKAGLATVRQLASNARRAATAEAGKTAAVLVATVAVGGGVVTATQIAVGGRDAVDAAAPAVTVVGFQAGDVEPGAVGTPSTAQVVPTASSLAPVPDAQPVTTVTTVADAVATSVAPTVAGTATPATVATTAAAPTVVTEVSTPVPDGSDSLTPVGPGTPESTVTVTVAPETTVPDTTVPDTTVPDTTVPDTTVPDTTVPDTTVPDTTVPDTTVPETTVPETTVPDTTAPPESGGTDCGFVFAGFCLDPWTLR